MKLDGQLESATLECLSGDPTSAPRARLYADITGGSKVVPKLRDATRWTQFLVDNSRPIAKTSNYTLTLDDQVCFTDATSGSFAVTLPSASSASGKVYKIIRSDNTFANLVTVTPNTGAETIDGAATYKLCTKNDSIEIVSDGSIWRLIQHTCNSEWLAYTPTGSWVANTTYTAFWRRVGDTLELNIQALTTGAPTSAALTVALPLGMVIDTAKLVSTTAGFNLFPGSSVIRDDSVTERYLAFAAYTSTIAIAILKDDGDGTLSAVSDTAPITFAASDAVRIQVGGIPITNWR